MATRNILKDGDRGLTKKSRYVTDFNKRLHMLLDDMRETLIEANGLGLAAPQVGVLRRVALIVDTGKDIEPADDQNEECTDEYTEEYLEEQFIKRYNEQIIELVNPEIINRTGEQSGSEGCLSVPGVYGIVTRPETVLFKAQDRYGNTFEQEVSELTARAVCHELDHLDGVIFTSIVERFLTEEELAEMAARRNRGQTDGDSGRSDDSGDHCDEAEIK